MKKARSASTASIFMAERKESIVSATKSILKLGNHQAAFSLSCQSGMTLMRDGRRDDDETTANSEVSLRFD